MKSSACTFCNLLKVIYKLDQTDNIWTGQHSHPYSWKVAMLGLLVLTRVLSPILCHSHCTSFISHARKDSSNPSIYFSHSRSSSSDWGCLPHSLHSCYLLRIDWSDCPHLAHDGGCYLGQHGGSESATLPLWQHHPGQEASLFARPWLEPAQVRTTSEN